MDNESKAVVLLSGGLDSTTVLAMALRDGHTAYPLNIDYGQRHAIEVKAANGVAAFYQLQLYSATVRFSSPIAGSALTADIDLPRDRSVGDMVSGVPVSYVPARNTFLLGLAASYAGQVGAEHIYTGFNSVDYSGYPDCRPEYVAAINAALALGMKQPVALTAPLVALGKGEIVQIGMSLGAPLHLTWSCYAGSRNGERPCGRCDSCIIRAAGFADAGLADPALP